MYEREQTAATASEIRGKAERDVSPTEAMLERLSEDLEKAQHMFSSLEERIGACLATQPPATDKGKPGLEAAAGSKLEEKLQRLRNQVHGLTERIVIVIDRVRL